jgi:hypothetical protein
MVRFIAQGGSAGATPAAPAAAKVVPGHVQHPMSTKSGDSGDEEEDEEEAEEMPEEFQPLTVAQQQRAIKVWWRRWRRVTPPFPRLACPMHH